MELEYDQYDLEEKKRREKEIEDPLQYVNESIGMGWKDAKRQFLEIPREISRPITPDSWWEEIDKEIAATKAEQRAIYNRMEKYTQKQNSGAAFALNMAGGFARSFSNPLEMAVRSAGGKAIADAGLAVGYIANSLYDVAEYAYENKSLYNRNIFEEFNSMDAAQLSGRMILNAAVTAGVYQKKNLNLDINGKPIEPDIRYKWREEYRKYQTDYDLSPEDKKFMDDFLKGKKKEPKDLRQYDSIVQNYLKKLDDRMQKNIIRTPEEVDGAGFTMKTGRINEVEIFDGDTFYNNKTWREWNGTEEPVEPTSPVPVLSPPQKLLPYSEDVVTNYRVLKNADVGELTRVIENSDNEVSRQAALTVLEERLDSPGTFVRGEIEGETVGNVAILDGEVRYTNEPYISLYSEGEGKAVPAKIVGNTALFDLTQGSYTKDEIAALSEQIYHVPGVAKIGVVDEEGNTEVLEHRPFLDIQMFSKNKYPFKTKTNISFVDDGLENDGQLSNGKYVELRYMSPDEYIETVSKGFKENDGQEYPVETLRKIRSASADPEGNNLLEKYTADMLNGDKFPALMIEHTSGKDGGKWFSQEGLHRAFAAKEAGIEMVPVAVVKDSKELITEGISEKRHSESFYDFQLFAKKKDPYNSKVVGGDKYTHVSNLSLMENKADILEKLNKLGVNINDWTLIKISKDGKIGLIKAPEFDTVSEPTITEWLDLETGTIRKSGKNPQILHRRYTFVNEDYKGFDIEEDIKRYSEYLDPVMAEKGIPKNKIGRREYWDNFLAENPRQQPSPPEVEIKTKRGEILTLDGLAELFDEEAGSNIKEAIFLLDYNGELKMWDGAFDMGSRGTDHNALWSYLDPNLDLMDLFDKYPIVCIEPENKRIYVNNVQLDKFRNVIDKNFKKYEKVQIDMSESDYNKPVTTPELAQEGPKVPAGMPGTDPADNWLYREAGYTAEEIEVIQKKLLGVDEEAKGKTNTGNSNKMPKMLSTVIPQVVDKNDRILNHGAGQFAKHHRTLAEQGYSHLYAFDPDPKLQREDFIAKNGEEYRGVNNLPAEPIDTIVTSNVMNVIPPKVAGVSKDGFYLEDYIFYLMDAAEKTGAKRVLVTVYEGDSKNNNKPMVMGGGTWQTNQKTEWYGRFLEPYGFELKRVKGAKYWEWDRKKNKLNIQLFARKKKDEEEAQKNVLNFLKMVEAQDPERYKAWDALTKTERKGVTPAIAWNFMTPKERLIYAVASHSAGDKMEGMESISTNCATNPFCTRMAKVEGAICGDCYAQNMMKGRPNLFSKNERITDFITTYELKPEDIPFVNRRVFRFEAFGELRNTTQLRNYIAIAAAPQNRKTSFALFFKNFEVVENYLAEGGTVPENFNMILSSYMKNIPKEIPEKLKGIVNGVFTVYNSDYVKEHGIQINCQQKCNECRVCYEFLPKEPGKVLYINELLKADEFSGKFDKSEVAYDPEKVYGEQMEADKAKREILANLDFLRKNSSKEDWEKFRKQMEQGFNEEKVQKTKKTKKTLTKFKLNIQLFAKEDLPFRMDTTGSELYDNYMKHPYELIRNNQYFKVSYITPKEYLEAVAAAKGTTIDAILSGADKAKILEYKKAMVNDEKFPMLVLNGEKSEGVSRALAAVMTGQKYIPVMKIKELPETFNSKEDLNKVLEEMNVIIPAREIANQKTLELWDKKEHQQLPDMPQYRARALIEASQDELLRPGDKILKLKITKDHNYRRSMKTTFTGKKGSRTRNSNYYTETLQRDVYIDALFVDKEGKKGIYTFTWVEGNGLTNIDLEIDGTYSAAETRPAPLDILAAKNEVAKKHYETQAGSGGGTGTPPPDGFIGDLAEAGEVAKRQMAGQPQGNYTNTVELDFKTFLKNTHELYEKFADEYYNIQFKQGNGLELTVPGMKKYVDGKLSGSSIELQRMLLRYVKPLKVNMKLHGEQVMAQQAMELFGAFEDFNLFKNRLFGMSESLDKQQFVEAIQGKGKLIPGFNEKFTEIMRGKVREYIAIVSGDETAKDIQYAYFTDLLYNKQKYQSMLGNIVKNKDVGAIKELSNYIGKKAKVTETEAFAAGLPWDEKKITYISIDMGGGKVNIIPVIEYSIEEYPVEVTAAFWNSYSKTGKQHQKGGKGLTKWEVGTRYGNEEEGIPAFNNFAESLRGFENKPYEILTTVYSEIANEKIGVNDLKTLLEDLRVNERAFSNNIVGEEKSWIKTLHQDLSEGAIKVIEDAIKEAEQTPRYRPNVWAENDIEPNLITDTKLVSKALKGAISWKLLASLNYLKEITTMNQVLASHGAHKLGWEPGFSVIKQTFIEPVRFHAQLASNIKHIKNRNLSEIKNWKDRRFVEIYLQKKLENEDIFLKQDKAKDNAIQGLQSGALELGKLGAYGQAISDVQRIWRSEVMTVMYMTKHLPTVDIEKSPLLKNILKSTGITQEEFVELKIKLSQMEPEKLAEEIFSGKVATTREEHLVQSLFEQFKNVQGNEFNPYQETKIEQDGFIGDMRKLYQRYSLGALDRTLEELFYYYDKEGILRKRFVFDQDPEVKKYKQVLSGMNVKDIKLYARGTVSLAMTMLAIAWIQGKITGTTADDIAEARMAALIEGEFLGIAMDSAATFAEEVTGAGVVLGLRSPIGSMLSYGNSMFKRAASTEDMETWEKIYWYAIATVSPQQIAAGIDNMKFKKNIPNRLTTASEEAQWQWSTNYKLQAQEDQERGELPFEVFFGTAVNWVGYFRNNPDKAEEMTGLKGEDAVMAASGLVEMAEQSAKETAIVEILNDPNTTREEKDALLKQNGVSFEQQFNKLSSSDKKLFSAFAALMNIEKEDELLVVMQQYSSAKNKGKWIENNLNEEEYKDFQLFQEQLEKKKESINSKASSIQKMNYENYMKYLEILRGM